jgi:hypothetical protein
MKLSFTLLTLSSNAILANAFPTLNPDSLDGLTQEKWDVAMKTVETFSKDKRFIIDIRKPIDITGNHAFKAPRETDKRGPCPGLNALANHAYISRTGITSFAEVVTAINQGSL